MLGEQDVPVVVEIAHDGDLDALVAQARHDLGDRAGGRMVVDRDPHQFAPGGGKGGDLRGGGRGVGGVRVGHRLDDDRVVPADHDSTDIHGRRGPALHVTHGASIAPGCHSRSMVTNLAPGRRPYMRG